MVILRYMVVVEGECFCVLVLIFISISQVFHRSASAGSPAAGSSRAASRKFPTGIESFPLPQVPNTVTEQQVCCRLGSKDTRGQNSLDLNRVLSHQLRSCRWEAQFESIVLYISVVPPNIFSYNISFSALVFRRVRRRKNEPFVFVAQCSLAFWCPWHMFCLTALPLTVDFKNLGAPQCRLVV